MDTAQFPTAITMFLGLLGGAVLLEFLAFFRNPRFRWQYTITYLVGVLTVVTLSGLGVYWGRGHFPTWVGTAAFFVLFWGVKRVLKRDDNRKPELERGKREIYGHQQRERERRKEAI